MMQLAKNIEKEARAARPPRIDKFAARRAELSVAVLETLAELGYARTSLREIAQKTEFSHGVLHYYFTDKVDLICASVRQYKAHCVTRYDLVTATARTRDELLEGFLDKLAETMRTDARMHRLWYDLRAQALFDDAFRADVMQIDTSLEQMVWRVASRYCELAATRPAMPPAALYALFDGLFQRHLLQFMAEGEPAIDGFLAAVRVLFPALDAADIFRT